MPSPSNSLHDISLLREDPKDELSLVVRLEGGRHNAVGARRKLEAARHFPHVDEGRRPGHGRVVLEEVHVKRPRERVRVAELGQKEVNLQRGRRKVL